MKSLSYLNKFFWKYKYRLIFGVIFIVISNIFAIYPAQIIREAFNEVQTELAPETIDTQSDPGFIARITSDLGLTETLILFAVLVVVMSLLKGLFTFFTRQTIIIMSRLIEFDLKNEIYRHYQELSPTFYRNNDTGDIMNRISEDVSRVRMYLGPGIMYSLNLVVLFVLVISVMVSINPKLTFYSLLPMPVLSVIIYYVSNIINRKSEEVQAQLSDISSAAQESFSGIRLLKAYVREAYAIRQYDNKSERYKSLALSLVKVEAIFMPVMMLLVGLSTILTIYVGGLETIGGNIEIGNIAEFVIYVNMLTWPVTAIGWVTSLTQRAAASQRRINEFLQTKPETLSGEGQQHELKGEIRFNQVGFRYEDSGIQALDDISFKIEPGNSLGIIGKTGSGKSTLVDLVSRNLRPDSGLILLDGISMLDIDLHDFRRQIGVVPQEAFLFSETIFENIAFGAPKADPDHEAVIHAAREAEIDGNIRTFPGQYETRVGERGVTLSGGQKQRISIARAIIRNPKIMVFDDCLSAVDTVTEKRILEHLKKQMSGRTTLIVSHRVSTVEQADEIIVLDHGKIVERGTHEDLINNNKLYAEMHKQQKLKEEQNITT